MNTSRRFFLRNGALALAGTTALPTFLTRAVMAATTEATAQGKKLVVIFQRGAADGLNIVVPYREKNYYAMRPTIAIPQNQVLDLDGFFGLHPSMASFKPLYEQGHLAIVHAPARPTAPALTSMPRTSWSPAPPASRAPAMAGSTAPCKQKTNIAAPHQQHTAFRAVALGSDVPRTLAGKIPAIAISNVQDFAVGGRGPKPAPAASAFEAMYDQSSDRIFHAAGD
jgi:uncharacterized protein (DUF1501 family)